MKTPQQWKEQFDIGGHDIVCNCDQCQNGTELFLTDKNIEEIQLDAFKQGMIYASRIVHNHAPIESINSINECIFQEINNLKELKEGCKYI